MLSSSCADWLRRWLWSYWWWSTCVTLISPWCSVATRGGPGFGDSNPACLRPRAPSIILCVGSSPAPSDSIEANSSPFLNLDKKPEPSRKELWCPHAKIEQAKISQRQPRDESEGSAPLRKGKSICCFVFFFAACVSQLITLPIPTALKHPSNQHWFCCCCQFASSLRQNCRWLPGFSHTQE